MFAALPEDISFVSSTHIAVYNHLTLAPRDPVLLTSEDSCTHMVHKAHTQDTQAYIHKIREKKSFKVHYL